MKESSIIPGKEKLRIMEPYWGKSEKAVEIHEARSANQMTSVDRSRAYPLPYSSDSKTKAVFTEPFLKRPLDLMLSTIMMVLSLPVFPLIFLAIILEGRGPIFYRQERWGRKGVRFGPFKFRTMMPNSDKDFGIRPAEENDYRVTKVGKVLRAMGLDELPQIINIFLGQMSFVGPRSLAVGEIVKDEKGRVVHYENVVGFWERLSVRPGLTGLATVYLPKDVPPLRKFRYDLLYIRKQSFWLDLRLIFLSFWISFRGKWETRGRKT